MKIARHRFVLQTAVTFMTAAKWGVQLMIEKTVMNIQLHSE